MNSKLYSNLGYSSEDIIKAIGNYLSLKDTIASNAWSFAEIKKPEDLMYAVDKNTIYLTTYDGFTHMIFAVSGEESITQFAFFSDGSIRYRKGKMEDDGVFKPDVGYTNFVTIFENYFTKDEINGFLSEVEKRLRKLETPAHEELVETTLEELQSEGVTVGTGTITDNTWSYIGADSMTINTCGRVAFSIESQTDVNVYIDDVLYGLGSFDGVVNQEIVLESTTLSSCSITFSRFAVTKAVGGILSDEQAEKVIKTEVYTIAEKNKLASSEVFTLDEKNELARVSRIGNATYTMDDTALIKLEEQGLISHDPDTVIEKNAISGGTQALIKFDAVGSTSRFVKIRGRSLRVGYDVLVDGKSLFTGATPASFSYMGKAQTIEFKSTGTANLRIDPITFEIAEFTDGHVTGQQVLDVDLLKEDVKTAQEDISGIEGQLANIYTKDETKAEITKEIEELVEATEGTLETLEKLKEALGGDDAEALTAITDELTKKMEKAEIQAISDVKSPTVVYLYNGSEEDVPFTSATIFSLKTTKTRFALASDGKIYYQTYLREEVSAEDATQTISIYSEWFEVSPEKVIEELSQRVSKLEVPAYEEFVETTLEEIATPEEGGGVVSGNTWSNYSLASLYLNVPGRVSFDVVENTNTAISIDGVLLEGNSFDGYVVNEICLLPAEIVGGNSITFGTIKITKYHGGILTDEQVEKVIRTEILTTPEKNKLAQTQVYTTSEKYHVDRLSKIKDAGYTWVQKNLIELQNEGKLIAGEDTVVTEDRLKGGSEVTINVDANVSLDCYLSGSTYCYIDGVLFGEIYNGYAHTITFKKAAYNGEVSVTDISLKVAQYNGGFITDEQIQDIEQAKYDAEWNAKSIDTLNTKAEAIKNAKVSRSSFNLYKLYANGQITNDTSELTCTTKKIEAPLGGDTIIQYTGKARLALDPVENLALYIDDVLIEDNEFYGIINNNITLKDNGTGGYTANFSYIQSLTYTGGMFSDAEFEVYEDLKYDFGKAEVLLDEVNQKTDAHIANKSNPHGVTASQINAFTKAQTRTEIQIAVDVAKTEIDSTKADKGEVANALKGNVSGEIVAMSDVSPVEHDVDVWVHSENLLPVPYFETSKEMAGVTYTAQEDGGILLSGTPTEYSYLRLYDGVCLEKEKPITISLTGEFTNAVFDFALLNASGVAVGTSSSTTRDGNVRTINTKDYPTAVRWTLSIKRESPGVEMTGVVYPKIEVGEVATPYKPWFDVTGATLTTCGKNLINLADNELLTEQKDGSFINTSRIKQLNVPLVLPKGIYTLSYDLKAPVEKNHRIRILFEDDSYTEKYLAATGKFLHFNHIINTEIPIKSWSIYYNSQAEIGELEIKNAQLEVGDTETQYEKFKKVTSAIHAGGNADVTSVYPTMTLFTDMDDAIIEAEYNRDLNKVDFGGSGESVDLSNYYNKDEVKALIDESIEEALEGDY